MFTHLDILKARILPTAEVSLTIYDTRLAALAAGVSRAFESYCGRIFTRAVDTVEEKPGGSALFGVDRYPIETVDTVEVRVGIAGDWSEWTIAHLSKSSGQILTETTAGSELDTVRITYTGGYYIDLSSDLSGTLPSGATALPLDLIDAWVLQCDHEARVRRIFGTSSNEDVGAPFSETFDLLPRVRQVLDRYRRMA